MLLFKSHNHSLNNYNIAFSMLNYSIGLRMKKINITCVCIVCNQKQFRNLFSIEILYVYNHLAYLNATTVWSYVPNIVNIWR